MFSEYNFRAFNFRLLFYAVALSLIGVIVINSAVGEEKTYVTRQLVGLFGGLLAAAVLSVLNYRYLSRFAVIAYLGCLAILLAVIIAGQLGGAGSGSRRWITLPVLGRFQPSEFAKIGLIFFFSWFLHKNQERINQPVTLLMLAGLAAAPLLLILEQPDLSTSIVIMFTILCMVFISGISYRLIFTAAAIGIPSLAAVMYLAHQGLVPFIEPYQVNRVLAFINPEKYAELNLQQDNSQMAIGSGMLYGKGLFNDTAISVKNGNYLSEEHTDFIFSDRKSVV